MIPELNSAFEIISFVSLLLVVIAMVLTFIRLAKGPSLPDRVIALDLLAVQAVGVVAIYATLSGEVEHLSAAMILALTTFLGTVAFASTIQRTHAKERKQPHGR